MTRRAYVGNDVVDLEDPRTLGRHEDARFLGRVLCAAERVALASSDDPFTGLWAFWAAKEAAYKVASKLRGSPPVFAHAAFVVTWPEEAQGAWAGRVEYEDVRVPVRVVRHGSALHAVAATSRAGVSAALEGLEPLRAAGVEWGERLDALLDRFTEREADAIHSVASAAVRLRARRALALALRVEESALEIICDPGVKGRRPPRVLLGGEPAAADVSLSHHGGWIAWAVLLQKPVGR